MTYLSIYDWSFQKYDWHDPLSKLGSFFGDYVGKPSQNVSKRITNKLRCIPKSFKQVLIIISRLLQNDPEQNGDEIIKPSQKKSKLLEQGYLSRSMIFYRVQNYIRCIDDCDAALFYSCCQNTDDGDGNFSNKYVMKKQKGNS